jgi:hypothetical protein
MAYSQQLTILLLKAWPHGHGAGVAISQATVLAFRKDETP